MGYYIQTGADRYKAETLVNVHKGRIVPQPKWGEQGTDKAIIVVVDNGIFEAAGLAFDQKEYEQFTLITDRRPKKFVLLDKAVAYKLAGYDPTEKVA